MRQPLLIILALLLIITPVLCLLPVSATQVIPEFVEQGELLPPMNPDGENWYDPDWLYRNSKTLIPDGAVGTDFVTTDLYLHIGAEPSYGLTQPAGWDERLIICIESDYVDSNLTDYPFPIHLIGEQCDAIFIELGANNLKMTLRDTDDDDCFVEIVDWDATNREAHLYALGNISASADTYFQLCYDSDQVNNSTYVGVMDSVPAETVWADYEAVYHMFDDSGTIYDSTANNRDLTRSGSVSRDGPFPLAAGEDYVTNDYAVAGDILDALSNDWTVEVFYHHDTNTAGHHLIAKGNRMSDDEGWSIFVNPVPLIYVRGYDGADKGGQSKAVVANQDYHVALRLNATANTIRGYLNGSNAGWVNYEGANIAGDINSNQNFSLGCVYDAGTRFNYFDGNIYEVRIAASALAVDYIETTADALLNNLVSIINEDNHIYFPPYEMVSCSDTIDGGTYLQYLPIIITEEAGQTETGTVVEIFINTEYLTDAGFSSNGNDVRFTYDNGTIIPHWLRKSEPDWNDKRTAYNLKLNLTADTTHDIRMYVDGDNGNITSTSSGTDVFDFFEDFNTDVANIAAFLAAYDGDPLTDWDDDGGTPIVSVTSSILTVDGGTAATHESIAAASFTSTTFRYMARAEEAFEVGENTGMITPDIAGAGGDRTGISMLNTPPNELQKWASGFQTTQNADWLNVADNYVIYEIVQYEGNYHVWYDDTPQWSFTGANAVAVKPFVNSFQQNNLTLDYIAVDSDYFYPEPSTAFPSRKVKPFFDDIRVADEEGDDDITFCLLDYTGNSIEYDAQLCLNVDDDGTGQNVYIYYGNPDACRASDVRATFEDAEYSPERIRVSAVATYNAHGGIYRLHDGRLIATWDGGTAHTSNDGEIFISFSENQGRTFSLPRVIYSHASYAADCPMPSEFYIGTDWVIVIAWQRHNFLSHYDANRDTFIICSKSGGDDWGTNADYNDGNAFKTKDGMGMRCRVIQMSNDDLAFTGYFNDGGDYSIYFLYASTGNFTTNQWVTVHITENGGGTDDSSNGFHLAEPVVIEVKDSGSLDGDLYVLSHNAGQDVGDGGADQDLRAISNPNYGDYDDWGTFANSGLAYDCFDARDIIRASDGQVYASWTKDADADVGEIRVVKASVEDETINWDTANYAVAWRIRDAAMEQDNYAYSSICEIAEGGQIGLIHYTGTATYTQVYFTFVEDGAFCGNYFSKSTTARLTYEDGYIHFEEVTGSSNPSDLATNPSLSEFIMAFGMVCNNADTDDMSSMRATDAANTQIGTVFLPWYALQTYSWMRHDGANVVLHNYTETAFYNYRMVIDETNDEADYYQLNNFTDQYTDMPRNHGGWLGRDMSDDGGGTATKLRLASAWTAAEADSNWTYVVVSDFILDHPVWGSLGTEELALQVQTNAATEVKARDATLNGEVTRGTSTVTSYIWYTGSYIPDAFTAPADTGKNYNDITETKTEEAMSSYLVDGTLEPNTEYSCRVCGYNEAYMWFGAYMWGDAITFTTLSGWHREFILIGPF